MCWSGHFSSCDFKSLSPAPSSLVRVARIARLIPRVIGCGVCAGHTEADESRGSTNARAASTLTVGRAGALGGGETASGVVVGASRVNNKMGAIQARNRKATPSTATSPAPPIATHFQLIASARSIQPSSARRYLRRRRARTPADQSGGVGINGFHSRLELRLELLEDGGRVSSPRCARGVGSSTVLVFTLPH